MHTPGTESGGVGVGTAAKNVVDHVKTLLGLDLSPQLLRCSVTGCCHGS